MSNSSTVIPIDNPGSMTDQLILFWHRWKYVIGAVFVGLVIYLVFFQPKSAFTNPEEKTSENSQNSQGDPTTPFNNQPYNTVDSYETAVGIQSSIIQPPMTDSRPSSIQNPADLLPRSEDKGQWSVSPPNGQGELMNVNLLKAGFHAGINTIGSSNRNANLQLRSEPPNPQMYNGPWNNSTITQDAVRRPVLEIGQGQD